MRRLRWILWGLVLVAGAAFALLLAERGRPVPPAAAIQPLVDVAELGGPFALTDQDGRAVSERDLAGRPYALFFGFTHCPDVCPTTLYGLTQLMAALGPDAERLRVLFVTVDPARDTVGQLKLYLSSFDPRITALTGTPDAVAGMLGNFRAYARKVPTGDSYTMDHTALVYLMGADGRFVSTLDMHEPQDIQLGKLKRLVAREVTTP
ncbi:protein SCO1/2 [Angulomicrobium tetraedrale]|uniref:Protein SCO1/2 n=1 Tax=Ancylobacter tetraedralis TaxID=217068 RepID=A0A839ZEZ8_9HYPH|nr:protein SCO1/2 [Ancylobacter tetraedralis]